MSIRVLIICDGPRDAPCVPRIIERILGAPVAEECRSWAHGTGTAMGFRRKLLFAIRQAKDAGAIALVATVDRDNEARRSRLKELQDGRARDREKILTVNKTSSPKEELNRLVQVRQAPDAAGADSSARIACLAAIAARLDPTRCRHDKETGFKAFAEDVRTELGPLVNSPPAGRRR